MLWDIRQPQAVASAATENTEMRSCAAFDPTTLVFAMAVADRHGRNTLKMYDIRKYSAGPFVEHYNEEFSKYAGGWDAIRYSPSGDEILLTPEYLPQSNTIPPHMLCDVSFGRDFTLKKTLAGHLVPMAPTDVRVDRTRFTRPRRSPQASFSPDSRYIVSSAPDRSIRVWSTSGDIHEVAQWGPDAHRYNQASREQIQPIGPVMWSPRTELVVSACSRLVLWLPQDTE